MTSDLGRFAQEFSRAKGKIESEGLQRDYLTGGSAALASMQPDYIVDASQFAATINGNLALYQHALSICLPAVTGARGVVEDLGKHYSVWFPEMPVPEIVLLFGSANSAGTVVKGRVIVSLERACEGVNNEAEFLARLKTLIAHEWIHTLQPELTDTDRRDLLVWALREGMASMLAAEVLGGDRAAQSFTWAVSRETALWQEFGADRLTLLQHWPKGGDPDATGQAAGLRWFWNSQSADGRPADLGYWIGQRIAAAWFSRQTDPKSAARDLVRSVDYDKILSESRYAP